MKSPIYLLVLCLITAFLCSAGCSTLPGAANQSPLNNPDLNAGNRVDNLSGSPGILTVSFLDVGQGDAILLHTPGDRYMLIDAGFMDAADLVVNDLKKRGITSLDKVVATHPHEDHIGGMDAVLNNFPVGNFIESGYPHTTRTYESMLDTIDRKHIPYRTVAAGDAIDLDPLVIITVLNPPDRFFDDINLNSIVLKVTYGQVSFLLMSDAGFESEDAIIKGGYDLSAAILKVGHHGSSKSSDALFLSRVRPEVGIIEVGADNEYGYPSKSTMRRLSVVGTKVYRTDLNGEIMVKTDGATYSITTER